MPVVLLERIPLPSLRTYTIVSFLLLGCSLYYAHITVTDVDSELHQHDRSTPLHEPNGLSDSIQPSILTLETEPKNIPEKLNPEEVVDHVDERIYEEHGPNSVVIELDPDEYLQGMVLVLIGEAWCVWTLVNMACCCLLLLGKLVQKVVFGELRVIEKQHVKDKFWNFVFYKFIFVFGVLNVEDLGEMVPWCSWFAVLCLLHLLAQLCKDRFEYLSFSPTTPLHTHIKVLSLLALINISSTGLLVLCAYIGYMFAGINVFGFMAAECILLIIKTQYVLTRYAIHLWDMHYEGVWENRATYVYYSELAFELAALSIDFTHHLHMLLWGNILLSMASLVICMQMRYLFHEFQRRIRRYKNFRRVVNSMEAKFPLASDEEIQANDDDCAICWEKMDSARKLPCGHLFHNACLRSWLEQDTTCPTCRTSLSDLQQRETGAEVPPTPTRPTPATAPEAPVPNPTFNHFFHFDGSRYVSWLPSFSVEVSHTQLLGHASGANPTRLTPAQTSLLDNMARQVQEVFPNMPLPLILDDLHVTRSVEISIENIIEGRLQVPPNFPGRNVDGDEDSSDDHPTYQPGSSNTLTSDPASVQLSPEASENSGARLNFVPDASPSETLVEDPVVEDDREAPQILGGRFSKSPLERESMLSKRKEMLMAAAKKRFTSKPHSEHTQEECVHVTSSGDLMTDTPAGTVMSDMEGGATSLTGVWQSDPESRREVMYRAVQRRLHHN